MKSYLIVDKAMWIETLLEAHVGKVFFIFLGVFLAMTVIHVFFCTKISHAGNEIVPVTPCEWRQPFLKPCHHNAIKALLW